MGVVGVERFRGLGFNILRFFFWGGTGVDSVYVFLS